MFLHTSNVFKKKYNSNYFESMDIHKNKIKNVSVPLKQPNMANEVKLS